MSMQLQKNFAEQLEHLHRAQERLEGAIGRFEDDTLRQALHGKPSAPRSVAEHTIREATQRVAHAVDNLVSVLQYHAGIAPTTPSARDDTHP